MKNAGLAGAIALCGIGLIMNGWQGQEESAHAHAASSMAGRPAVLDVFEACVEAEPVALFDQVGESLCFGTLIGDQAQYSAPYWYPVPFGLVPEQQFKASDLDGDGHPDRVMASEMMTAQSWQGGLAGSSPEPIMYRWNTESGWSFGSMNDAYLDIPPALYVQAIRPSEQGWSLSNRLIDFDFEPHRPDDQQDWSVYPALHDVDGDGRDDLVLQWRNTMCFMFNDPCEVVGTWHRNLSGTDPLAGDVNNDGQVNGADLTIVLSDWTG